MATRLHDEVSRRQTFESLYRAIEQRENRTECAVDDAGFVAGVHTDPRDSSVVYAERLGTNQYFGVLLKPSFANRMPTPMEHIRNPGEMPQRLTHCSAHVVVGDLALEQVRSARELRGQLLPEIRFKNAETTETYQTIHNRGQLRRLYDRHAVETRRAQQ
jgi:phosphoglycolate phosphatase-like HAD superfamily hydrolase